MNAKRTRRPPSLILQRLASFTLLVLYLAGGCTLFQPVRDTGHYYILTSTSPAVSKVRETGEHPARCLVRIEPVELADYLKTKEIAVRTGANEINLAVFHQWAEPLDYGIRRVLAEDLRGSPGGYDVVSAQNPAGASASFTVSIRVVACQGVRLQGANSVEFGVVWYLTGETAILESGEFRMQPTDWDGHDYGKLAQRLSRAVGELSTVLNEAVSREASAPSLR